MSTHLPGYQSLFRIFESVYIGQISHQQLRVNVYVHHRQIYFHNRSVNKQFHIVTVTR